MASVLDFERYRSDLGRQLLRRIGYTNGLHKLRRFARVVEYLYPIMPTSSALLAQIIIDRENRLIVDDGRPLKGSKYAKGIVDVAQQLVLLERFGTKIALSSQGYACHALNNLPNADKALNSFLLHKVLEAHGEYTLNILRLVSEGLYSSVELGRALMRSFSSLIDFKLAWAATSLQDRFSQRTISALLNEAKTTLGKALEGESSAVGFFFKHTVNPRLEWLRDLGCIREIETTKISLLPSGIRLLDAVRQCGYYRENFIYLPLDRWLASELDVPPFGQSVDQDFDWKLVAQASSSSQGTGKFYRAMESPQELLNEVKTIYPLVKLANFNEADALSLYEVFESFDSLEGSVLPRELFDQSLLRIVNEFSGEIFKLSKRRGRGLYIALKGTG